MSVLDDLGSNCRLRTFTLSCGTILTKRDVTTARARNLDLENLANIVARSVCMRRFILKAWPMYENALSNVDILGVLRDNERIAELEALSLFWQDASESSWATLNAQLPSPDSMLATVNHFRFLKSLCLRSTMISNKVIKELAEGRRAPLSRLGILLTFSRQEPNGGIPEISYDTWNALKAKSPNLGVDITVVTRIPYDNLHGFLKPELPLASINFMKYSRCSRDDLSSIADKYNQSLLKFVDYSDGVDCDNHLVGLVTRCKVINYFQYYGKIHYSTVLHLARLRAQKWYHFQVNFDNISTHALDTDHDDNQVIARHADGSVEIVDGKMGDSNEDLLDGMVRDVGQIIGQKWQPINRKMVEEKLNIVESNIGIVPLKVALATEAAAAANPAE